MSSRPFTRLLSAGWETWNSNGTFALNYAQESAQRLVTAVATLADHEVAERASPAAAGETAPLLFTAFGNRFWSTGWNQPTASLPVMIYTYAVSPYDDWHRQAWAAGLVLLGLVLLTNIIARVALSRGILSPRT